VGAAENQILHTPGGQPCPSINAPREFKLSKKADAKVKGRSLFLNPLGVLLLWVFILGWLGGVRAAAETPWNMIGPPGGDVRGIAVNPLDTREMYAAVYSLPAQIYKSDDSGQNWRLIALLNTSLNAISIAPSSPNIVYVLGFTSVFKSTDRGATWKEYPLGSSRYGDSGEIAVSRSNPDLVYACGYYSYSSNKTCMAVFKSSDGGESWSTIPLSSSSNAGYSYSLAFDPTSESVLYVGGYDSGGSRSMPRLFKSMNGGDIWTDITGSIQGDPDAIAIDAANPSRIFVGSTWGVFRSGDGGQTWSSAGINSAVTAMAIDSSNPDIVFAGSTGTCYRTTDGGANWSTYKIGLRGDCRGLYEVSGQLLYASSAGVYRSSDGGISWRESRTGLVASQVPTLAVASDLPNVLYTAVKSDGYFKSDTFGLIWERLPDFGDCDDVRKIGVDPTDADRVVVLSGG
jgi:photosystem II stability/assembly factor-like uncharacterized protein